MDEEIERIIRVCMQHEAFARPSLEDRHTIAEGARKAIQDRIYGFGKPQFMPEQVVKFDGQTFFDRIAKFLSDEFRECPPYWDDQSNREHEEWRSIAKALVTVANGGRDPRY